MKKGKSVNGLMKHIRNQHEISISGTKDKQKLLEMGYYHGYKSYKYIGNVNSTLGFKKFSQINALYEFDNSLKHIFYPVVMNFETSLKNLVLDIIVTDSSPYMNDVYVEHLNRHKILSRELETTRATGNNLKRLRNAKKNSEQAFLRIKSNVAKQVSYNYKRDVVSHYIQNGEDFPVWAIFELIMLGDFGDFIGQLNTTDELMLLGRLELNEPRNIEANIDLLQGYIYLIKDLRNAVAHNSIVFDTRFKSSLPSSSIKQQIKYAFNLEAEPNFNSIIDYVSVLLFFMKRFNYSLKARRKFISEIKLSLEKTCQSVSDETMELIVPNWKKHIEMISKSV